LSGHFDPPVRKADKSIKAPMSGIRLSMAVTQWQCQLVGVFQGLSMITMLYSSGARKAKAISLTSCQNFAASGLPFAQQEMPMVLANEVIGLGQ
jgi:hypothetical protein